MGIHKNVGYDRFPQQNYIGREVNVSFGYDTRYLLHGVIVRNDIEAPGTTVIQLDDGRFVLGSECFYEEIHQEFKNEQVLYNVRDVGVDIGTRHIVVGSISGRDHIDMTNHTRILVREGQPITEELFQILLKQGRKVITIRESIPMDSLAETHK